MSAAYGDCCIQKDFIDTHSAQPVFRLLFFLLAVVGSAAWTRMSALRFESVSIVYMVLVPVATQCKAILNQCIKESVFVCG